MFMGWDEGEEESREWPGGEPRAADIPCNSWVNLDTIPSSLGGIGLWIDTGADDDEDGEEEDGDDDEEMGMGMETVSFIPTSTSMALCGVRQYIHSISLGQ